MKKEIERNRFIRVFTRAGKGKRHRAGQARLGIAAALCAVFFSAGPQLARAAAVDSDPGIPRLPAAGAAGQKPHPPAPPAPPPAPPTPAPSPPTPAPVAPTPAAPSEKGGSYAPDIPGKGQGRLRVKVIDGRSQKPIEGAEVVLLENERRYRTDKNGLTPWIQAPVIRNSRYRFMVRELHGQLTLISFKNGYRDSIHMGVRIDENQVTKTTIWQYRINPALDRRVEPVLYIEPYHRLWLIELADRFRRPTQLGEGYEHP